MSRGRRAGRYGSGSLKRRIRPMAMTLYGSQLSPYVARVALAARFKGMKYTLAPPPGGLKSPEFLKINPLGKIPVLKDGATLICESAVIVEYLEAKGKTKKLVPKSAKAAAVARQVGAVATEYVQTVVRKFFPFLQGPIENPK
ncbi:MAG: glutathione S-transferase family protein, partial [Rhodospirillaceae bacterium]